MGKILIINIFTNYTRPSGGRVVASSNLVIPTNLERLHITSVTFLIFSKLSTFKRAIFWAYILDCLLTFLAIFWNFAQFCPILPT